MFFNLSYTTNVIAQVMASDLVDNIKWLPNRMLSSSPLSVWVTGKSIKHRAQAAHHKYSISPHGIWWRGL